MDQHDVTLAVQGHWLQYMGLTIESVRSWHRMENAAWKASPPSRLGDLPPIGTVMVAS